MKRSWNEMKLLDNLNWLDSESWSEDKRERWFFETGADNQSNIYVTSCYCICTAFTVSSRKPWRKQECFYAVFRNICPVLSYWLVIMVSLKYYQYWHWYPTAVTVTSWYWFPRWRRGELSHVSRRGWMISRWGNPCGHSLVRAECIMSLLILHFVFYCKSLKSCSYFRHT